MSIDGQATGEYICTYRYFVRNVKGEQIHVCKDAFCKLHAIGKRRVEVISTKMVSGVLFSGDNRGLHGSRPHTITGEIKGQVREHIESFPARESHYSRQDNLKHRYLPESVSIARMYCLFLEKYEPEVNEEDGEKPCVKEWLYRNIFNEEYNFGFGYPRSDTCEKCDILKVASDNAKTEEERSEIIAELASHHEKAALGYGSLRSDFHKSKSDPSKAVITFDLQQNLPVPTLTHQKRFSRIHHKYLVRGHTYLPNDRALPRSRRGNPVLGSIYLRIGRRLCVSLVPLNHFLFRK